jgi:uncharacterized protein YggL (DUF469 family)
VNRRQRKKLRLGEFRSLGFRAAFVCVEKGSLGEFEGIAREWLFDLCDRLGLERCMAAWPPRYGEIFAVRTQGAATEEDRRAISGWLRQSPGVARSHVGPLVDVTYAPLDDDDPLWEPQWGPVHYLVIPDAARGTRLACSRPFLAWLSRDFELNGPLSEREPGVVRGVIRPA